MDTEDEPTFQRKHRSRLRRESSFKRMQSVPQQVDDWFHSNASLHASWQRFVDDHRADSPSFVPSASGSMVEADHTARLVHEKFCEMFESSLQSFLTDQSVSMEEFQEAFRLSRDEEARDGTCFYRWPDVVEFEVFLCLMRQGADALLATIRQASETARLEHRKRVTLAPLLYRWTPKTFEEVDEIVTACSAVVPLHLSRAESKEASRWRIKLAEKKIGQSGVYELPPRDEAEWSRYLSFATKNLGARDFELFVATLEKKIVPSADNASDSTERRAVLQCFDALDVFHRGKLALSDCCQMIGKANVVSSKVLNKTAKKWELTLHQRFKDAAAVGNTSEFDSDDDGPQMNMASSIDFLTELLKPKEGADAGTLFLARLQHIVDVAHDRT